MKRLLKLFGTLLKPENMMLLLGISLFIQGAFQHGTEQSITVLLGLLVFSNLYLMTLDKRIKKLSAALDDIRFNRKKPDSEKKSK